MFLIYYSINRSVYILKHLGFFSCWKYESSRKENKNVKQQKPSKNIRKHQFLYERICLMLYHHHFFGQIFGFLFDKK